MNAYLLVLVILATVDSPGVDSTEGWGHLSGEIVVVGDVAPAGKLRVTQDEQFCGKHDLRDESLQVSDQGGLKNAFVFLMQSRRERQDPAIHPSYSDEPAEDPVLDNKDCRFEPHTMLLRTTQTLLVKNSDEIGHNANIESRDNGTNPQIPANRSQPLMLTVSERSPIKVSCGSHGWMSAYVLIRDEPYNVITDAEGRFTIENLPAGEWTFQFWHERCGFMSDLEQSGEPFAGRRGEVTLTIRDGQTTDLGKLTIDSDALSDD